MIELVYVGRIARETGICHAVHGLRLARERGIEAHLSLLPSSAAALPA